MAFAAFFYLRKKILKKFSKTLKKLLTKWDGSGIIAKLSQKRAAQGPWKLNNANKKETHYPLIKDSLNPVNWEIDVTRDASASERANEQL